MFSIHSIHIVINEVQYSRIMGHIYSSNSFFNCKILYVIVGNWVHNNCDKILGETTCLPILLHIYQFCTILKLLYNVHMLHLVANSTSFYDYIIFFLLLSPILLPCCLLTQFPNPMGSPLKITSNLGRLFILLNIVTVWRDIVVNNAKVASSFECGPLLVSSGVKLVWSSTWRLFMVIPYLISSPIMLYKTCFKFRLYLNFLVLGLHHPQNIW